MQSKSLLSAGAAICGGYANSYKQTPQPAAAARLNPCYHKCRNLRQQHSQRSSKFLLPQAPQSTATALQTRCLNPATAGAAIVGGNAPSTTQSLLPQMPQPAAATLPTLLKFLLQQGPLSAVAEPQALLNCPPQQVPVQRPHSQCCPNYYYRGHHNQRRLQSQQCPNSCYRRCRNLRRLRSQRYSNPCLQSLLSPVPQSAAATLPTLLKLCYSRCAIGGGNASSTTQMPTTTAARQRLHSQRCSNSTIAGVTISGGCASSCSNSLPQVPQSTAAAQIPTSRHHNLRRLRS